MGGNTNIEKKDNAREVPVPACRPPPGKTYLTIGQDLFSVEEYIKEQYNASIHRSIANNEEQDSSNNGINTIIGNDNSTTMQKISFESFFPAAYMFYTDIQSLKGLYTPTDYGTGVEYADGLLLLQQQNKPMLGIQVGLWLNGYTGCQDIIDGKLDDNIRKLFHYFTNCHASKVYLRVGYEFDNPDFRYASRPELYVKAFQKLVNICYKINDSDDKNSACDRNKILFVWHSWGAGISNAHATLDDYYPGDNYVDWIGVSIFQQFYSTYERYYGGTIDNVYEVLDYAKQHNKPTMIAESTPFGGIHHNHNCYHHNDDGGSTCWDQWFQPVLDLIEKYDISMFSYINCDWDSQPLWHGVGFGDTRLSIDKNVMNLWYQKVLNNPRYLFSGSTNDCECDNGDEDSHRDKINDHNDNTSNHHDVDTSITSLSLSPPSFDSTTLLQQQHHYQQHHPLLMEQDIVFSSQQIGIKNNNGLHSYFSTQNNDVNFIFILCMFGVVIIAAWVVFAIATIILNKNKESSSQNNNKYHKFQLQLGNSTNKESSPCFIGKVRPRSMKGYGTLEYNYE